MQGMVANPPPGRRPCRDGCRGNHHGQAGSWWRGTPGACSSAGLPDRPAWP